MQSIRILSTPGFLGFSVFKEMHFSLVKLRDWKYSLWLLCSGCPDFSLSIMGKGTLFQIPAFLSVLTYPVLLSDLEEMSAMKLVTRNLGLQPPWPSVTDSPVANANALWVASRRQCLHTMSLHKRAQHSDWAYSGKWRLEPSQREFLVPPHLSWPQ